MTGDRPSLFDEAFEVHHQAPETQTVFVGTVAKVPGHAEVCRGRLWRNRRTAEELASFAGQTVFRVDRSDCAGASPLSDILSELFRPLLHFAFDLRIMTLPHGAPKFPPNVYDHPVQKLDQVEQKKVLPEFGRMDARFKRVVGRNITCVSLDRGRDETPGKKSAFAIRQSFQLTKFLCPNITPPLPPTQIPRRPRPEGLEVRFLFLAIPP